MKRELAKVLKFNPDCSYRSKRAATLRELVKLQYRVLVIVEELEGYRWKKKKKLNDFIPKKDSK